MTVVDEYAAYPDLKIDVAKEQALLASADRVVLQFPMFWYSTPALLKQWQDDVLTYGWAYGTDATALHGEKLFLALSTGSSTEAFTTEGLVGYTVDELYAPLHAMANLCGFEWEKPFVVHSAMGIAEDALAQAEKDYVVRLQA